MKDLIENGPVILFVAAIFGLAGVSLVNNYETDKLRTKVENLEAQIRGCNEK